MGRAWTVEFPDRSWNESAPRDARQFRRGVMAGWVRDGHRPGIGRMCCDGSARGDSVWRAADVARSEVTRPQYSTVWRRMAAKPTPGFLPNEAFQSSEV